MKYGGGRTCGDSMGVGMIVTQKITRCKKGLVGGGYETFGWERRKEKEEGGVWWWL